MPLISFILFISVAWSQELPKFLTKHSPDTLRYISMDGRTAYVQKKPGVLGFVNSFKSVDFLTETSASDFILTGSPDKIKLAIEVVSNPHTEYNLLKNNKIIVVNWGNTQTKDVGFGRSPKLHLKDEWITYYDAYDKMLHIQNISTQKKFEIKLAAKANPFFIPEVVMVAQDNVTYTDINENGFVALITFNLSTKVSTVIYRSPQSGTKLELCRNDGYVAVGEFPYEGISRGSKIMHIKLSSETNLAGYTTIYNTVDQDLGNMVCHPTAIFFIKTMSQEKKLNTKTTDAVRLDLKTHKIEAKTSEGNITQLIEMDGRVMIAFRGDFYVIEGISNLSSDTLKAVPTSKEELPLDI
ncbi:MAG TPA: hypothetical protein VNJ08_02305 [Bacteriovoracaceae bacterium]|nr:hypothetical protein [Bacteriovoracaceae bacterium]